MSRVEPKGSQIAPAAWEERCWEVLERRRALQRDGAAEALTSFFYGVASTGIYCRPLCPSRLPRRENVRFFTTAAAAEQAGFRACFRCRPGAMPLEERQAALIATACDRLRVESVPLGGLAAEAGLSSFHFHRLFRKLTGKTPKAFERECRAVRVREALSRAESVTEAIYAAGYQSGSRFYAEATGTLGMKPARYLKLATMKIKYIIKPCSLGYLLLGATEKGVCTLILGSRKSEVLEGLRVYFPKAELVEAADELAAWGKEAVQAADDPQHAWNLPSIPLDLHGTPFQHRVWKIMRAIPCGKTMSYGEIALKLGMPTGARAVASACASNRVAIAVPCHRVVHGDGTLSGYRWGVERKKKLLRREGAVIGGQPPLL